MSFWIPVVKTGGEWEPVMELQSRQQGGRCTIRRSDVPPVEQEFPMGLEDQHEYTHGWVSLDGLSKEVEGVVYAMNKRTPGERVKF